MMATGNAGLSVYVRPEGNLELRKNELGTLSWIVILIFWNGGPRAKTRPTRSLARPEGVATLENRAAPPDMACLWFAVCPTGPTPAADMAICRDMDQDAPVQAAQY